MAAQPKEDDIQMVIEFSSGLVDRARALRYLQVANNEVQAAVNLIFDDTPLEQLEQQRQPQPAQGYDESAFNQDRYGSFGQSSNLPAFQIDAADDSVQFPRSSAPTRPPSRVSTRTIDSAINLVDVPVSGRTSRMDLDRSGQETGVLGNSGAYFGPATKSHYDASQWAMTLSGPRVAESIPDVEPQQRRRGNGEPAFLKPLPSKDFLPNLITILSHIPLARNALLFGSHLLTDYGYDPNWWTGAPTQARGAVEITSESMELGVIRESQRLMAFLDASDRSYGSVEALSTLSEIASAKFKDTGEEIKALFEKFLITWEINALKMDPEGGIADIFSSDVSSGHSGNCFWTMDIDLSGISASKPWSLYDVLDDLIYMPVEPTPSIKRFGKVLVMRITQPQEPEKGLDMEIPSSWFVDRYMEENLERTKVMKEKISSCKDRIAKVVNAQNDVQRYSDHRSERNIDTLALLQASMAAFRKTEASEIVDELTGRPNRKTFDRTNGHVLEALQAVCSSVDVKVKSLEAEKNKIIGELRKASELLKVPTSDPRTNPIHRYRLMGCSPSPETTYVLHRIPSNPFEDDGASSESSQWWKIQYNADSSQPSILKEKVLEEEVLRAAKDDGRDCLLIYADDEALAETPIRLPRVLGEFVQHDNATFRNELEEAVNRGWDNTVADIDMDDENDPPPYDDYTNQHVPDQKRVLEPNVQAFDANASISISAGVMGGQQSGRAQRGVEHVEYARNS